METTAHTTKPRIYAACLAAYNNGILHGAWIDADQEAMAIYAEISRMLAASPMPGAEEAAIHDHEGFEGFELEEFAGIDRVCALAAFILEHGKLGAELLSHFGGDLVEASEAMEERYLGAFENLADYAQTVTEECETIPHRLAPYIDWNAMARDLEMGGDVFTIALAHDETHVFLAY